jgi:uncharacterized membrane protein SpoIIM required for sporulation
VEEREFVGGSREVWERLATAVAAVRSSGVKNMGVPALRQMHEDYRHAAADLAYAQTHFPRSEAAEYLNRLVGSAHGELYAARPRRLAAIWQFIATDYPQLVRRSWRPVALAAALLVVATAVGWTLAYTDPGLARLLLPEPFRDTVGQAIERDATTGDVWVGIAPAISAAITINNVQVSLTAFAGGMTFGAITAWALVNNGLLLGVLAGAYGRAGSSLVFWSLIVPHGALELPAIALAGASGLMLAGALLFPGDRPRTQALRAVAPDAVRLVLGVIPLLLVAGLIEGFVTPRAFGEVPKLVFGAVAALGLVAYIALPGRGPVAPEPGHQSRPRALTSR